MKVQSVYRPLTDFVTPSDSLRYAARKMRETGQGCLPVLDGSAVAGIVTERDMTECIANGAEPSEAHIADYSRDGSVTVSVDDDCEIAELKMLAIGCRNLPVVVGGSRLVGTISLRDLVLKAPTTERVRAAAIENLAEWPDEPAPDADSG